MLETFLTAYDPSDLPGSSVDPLGFERGYLALADEILPGLTNVASQPRYFGLLCAGVHLGAEVSAANPREVVRQRKEILLRMERYWALGNVLARGEGKSGGVRGVTYAVDREKEIRRNGTTRVDAEFPLLSRQAQYGALGMYGTVAEGMRFLSRETFTLSADLGEPMAEAFIRETAMPRSLRVAIESQGDVPESTLREWGERAHVAGTPGKEEAAYLAQAAHYHPIRSRMLRLLRRFPNNSPDEGELRRLRRIEQDLRASNGEPDLRAAMLAILAYEDCFRRTQLALERLLWLCRRTTSGAIDLPTLAGDPVILRIRKELPVEARRFAERAAAASLVSAWPRLDDVRAFIARAGTAASEAREFIEAIMQRHADVQHGKFDRGRRKMPWLEWNEGRIVLSPTPAGGLNFEATSVEDIEPHPYRLNAADALNRAANGR